MPQASPPDKRCHVLLCHGPSCSQSHERAWEEDTREQLKDVAKVHTGGCLGMCPVGPNAIVRREPIPPTKAGRRIAEHDSILCGLADVEDLVRLVHESNAAEEPPRLLKGHATPANLQR